jgi:hypothetical protein
MEDVTHKEIYDRLIAVEGKVDSIDTNTKGLVDAFNSLQGAFKVLGWIGSAAKPVLWVAGAFTAASLFWSQFVKK